MPKDLNMAELMKRAPVALPLVVDLDGTLIHSDLLWEAILIFIKTRFLQLWRLPFWLLQGKAGFKDKLASMIEIDPSALPYDQILLADLARQRSQGRLLVLATGSQRRYADVIAAHLGLFERVFASEGGVNLTAHSKARQLSAAFGAKGFDYIGNATVDIAVWNACNDAFSVTRKPFLLAGGSKTQLAGTSRAGWGRPLIKAMRPRQWLKNLLVFVPMLAGHALNMPVFLQALVAFVAFSLCASSAYLLNDALDAVDDRRHPVKCHRPIAAGSLPLPVALLASPLLAIVALGICAVFDPLLLLVVVVYFITTLAYSIHLKRLLMVDIVTLAILYTLRILGGSAVTHIEPSFWLLAFSFFIFLSLALLKRYSELFNLERQGKEKTNGRSYTTMDKAPVGIMGVNSGFISLLVFMLYFNSENVLVLYTHPHFLLGIVPLLVFWLGRLWTLSFRGEVNEDPVLYVSRDPISLCIIAACMLLAVGASM